MGSIVALSHSYYAIVVGVALGDVQCGRQLDRHEQNKDNGPGIGHQVGKARVPSNGQNWENKDLAPKVTFSPLAYHWSCGLDLMTFHITGHAVQTLP